MSEERPAEGEIVLSERKPTETGARWVDLVGGILGLIVFVVGIILIYQVFVQAKELYTEIGPTIQALTTTPAEGGVEAAPGGRSVTGVLAEFGLKFLWMLLIAFVGCLISGLGAKLAGAHRGKRT